MQDWVRLCRHLAQERRSSERRKPRWNAAELRLHTARLYGYSGYPMQTLHISILWSGPAASVKTELRRFLRDTGYGRGDILVAWHTQWLGDGAVAFNMVSVQLDQFLLEYLRANPECRR